MKEERIASRAHPEEISVLQLAVFGTPVVFAAYTLVLSVGHDSSLLQAVPGGLANTVATVFFGLIAYWVILHWLKKRRAAVQFIGHLVVCSAYALSSYWLLIVLLGAVTGLSVIQFEVVPFPVRASVWQLLEDVTIYGILAALAYRNGSAPEVRVVLNEGRDETPTGLSRYFIRSGDEIQPIDVHSIVSISGADDYADVATLDGRHLVRMTLAEFERSLDPARFIRVHRSRIVNVERIDRAEPAGNGRLLLHMQDGEAIPASRTGSRLLRDRVL